MNAEGAVIAQRDGAVLRLTLDRPASRTSLSHSRAIHIVGAGDDFCAGADWVTTNTGDLAPAADFTVAANDARLAGLARAKRMLLLGEGLAAFRERRTPEFHGR